MAIDSEAFATTTEDSADQVFAKHTRNVVFVFEALNFAALCVWLFAITPGWVMAAANSYAERLLDVLDSLGNRGA